MIKIEEYMELSLQERKSHIKLDEPCVFRNVKHRQECRGILAYVLDTTLPARNTARLCHACNVGECCNPAHMYWGTSSENSFDSHASNPEHRAKIAQTMRENHLKKLKVV